MAHRIDAEHDQESGQAAIVSLRPGPAASASRARPATQPVIPAPSPDEPQQRGKRLWDKNNFGFWLTVCIVISLVFSILYRALA